MKIDSRSVTQAIYFTKKPPEFFIPAITDCPVTDREMEAALLFYENNLRTLLGQGLAKDDEIIQAVQKNKGFGPVMVTRRIESLLLLPADVN